MKTVKLPVVITRDEDGYYLAEVPVLTSCFAQGKTKAEALDNLNEVIPMCLEHMAKAGEPLPKRFSMEEIEVAVA